MELKRLKEIFWGNSLKIKKFRILFKIIKTVINFFLRILFKIFNIDIMFTMAQSVSRFFANLLFYRDWACKVNGLPKYFDHHINLYRWTKDPKQWDFIVRGFYPREKMFPGCKVLDLCCGDGSYSYLFYSDIAGLIDAVDADGTAIKKAEKINHAANIKYHQLDIIKDAFPSSGYDFVIWNAAICYFDLSDIHKILKKIAVSGNGSMQLYGITPLATGFIDHKHEFGDTQELKVLLEQYFADVHLKEVKIENAKKRDIYFRAKAPVYYET